MIGAFIKGLILSLSLVVPLGSQNIFIFNQAMVQTKYRQVLPVVLITGCCDALLIVLAVFSVDLFLNIAGFKPFILTMGIIFLSYVGYSVFHSSSQIKSDGETPRMSLLKQIVFAISVSLLNPHAIMDLFVIIGSVSADYQGIEKQAFITGCILIDFAWFFLLSMGGFHLKKIKYAEKISIFINKTSAIIMWTIAVVLTIQLFNTLNLRFL